MGSSRIIRHHDILVLFKDTRCILFDITVLLLVLRLQYIFMKAWIDVLVWLKLIQFQFFELVVLFFSLLGAVDRLDLFVL